MNDPKPESQSPRVEIIPPGKALEREQLLRAEPVERPRPAPKPLRAKLAWIPGIPTFVALWIYLLDDDAPLRHRLAIFFSIVYVIVPLDLLPDWVLGPLGLADDAAVIAGLLSFLGSAALKPYRAKARAFLKGEIELD